MIPLQGFVPDADPTVPGVITDCDGLIPFEAGFKGAPSNLVVSDALDAACRGAASVSNLSGTRRLIAGTAAGLYELSTSSWTDQTGSAHTLGADDRWSFVQFGNSTLAATPTEPIQRSTGAAFADVSGAPQAKIIAAASGFVMALNTSTSQDEWYCSAYLDDTNWTLALSNQCVKGRLVGGSGPITAGLRFGDGIVAYKAGAVFFGRYVGAPVVWDWTEASTDVGCVGQDAVVDTGKGHVFVGRDNVYLYDGTYPRPIGEGIRRWLFADMAPAYQFKTQVLWDRKEGQVWIFYCSASSTTPNRAVVYHMQTQRWGVANRSIEAIVTYSAPGFTYDTGSSLISTYDSADVPPYDSPFWIASSPIGAVFDTDHKLATLTGAAGTSWFVTGSIGDDQGQVHCDALRVRYTSDPTTSTATGYVKDAQGEMFSQAGTATLSDGRHDMRQTGRFHQFRVVTTGDFKVTAIRPNFRPAGGR